MEEIIAEIGVDEIRISPFQPRREFSDEDLEELSSSIKEVGVIQPPLVRKIEQGSQFLYYELVCGERRWRAAKKAGLSTIRCLIRDLSDEEAATLSLIENMQRVDLNPIEVAYSLKKLADVFQFTQEEVADRVGKKRSTVTNYLRLLTLPSSIQEGLVEKAITVGHAKAILSLDSPELKTRLYDLIVQKNMSVRETEKESQKMVRSERNKELPEDDLSYVQSYLEKHLGSRVEINRCRDKKRGKLLIHFFGNDDLERLLDLLGIKVPEEV